MGGQRYCVTANTPSGILAQYAHALQIAAPREWEAFVECFDAYATEVTVAVTNADQSGILSKQGQAQAFLHLLKLFRNCHKPQPSPAKDGSIPVLEGVKPLTSANQLDADPNVVVPEHVRRASAAADAMHQQFYPKDDGQAPAPNKEALPQPLAPEALHTPAAPAADQPAPPDPAPEQPHDQAPLADQNVSAEDWRHRFLSMQGRYNAQVRTNAGMEEQMRQLGEELVRTQNLIGQQAPHAPQLTNSDTRH